MKTKSFHFFYKGFINPYFNSDSNLNFYYLTPAINREKLYIEGDIWNSPKTGKIIIIDFFDFSFSSILKQISA